MPGPLSPPAESGGLLHFPSPRHFHGIDPALKIRELRRSLSRSPSKSPFRLKSSKSSKSSSPAPVSPSTPSSIGHSPSTSSLADGGTVPIDKDPQDPIKSPVAPSTRRNRQTTFRPSPMRTVAHPEPRHSPIQRTLSERTDNGNATPRSSGTSSDDVENRSKRSMSPDEPFREHGAKRKSTELFDSTAGSRAAMERLEKGGSLGRVTAKSSPLKRSDGMMHLDSSYLGSPAKRRSLHGTTAFGPDFNIFDQSAELQSAQPRRDEGDSMDVSGGGDSQPTPSHTPRRASSWRRTMQSRHEKPIFARSRLNSDLAHDFPAAGQSTLMGRPRMSLDNHLPPPIPHDSPFSSHGGLPSASVHPVSQGESQVSIFSRVQHGRHPLSRTISQSSSTSLRTDDSPTHIPERRPERRRNPVDFSKSLPVGSRRPASSDSSSQGPKTSRPSQEGSCSTPENFHQAIPHPVAFMSTGLISKRNRPLDEAHPEFQPNTSMMPDTPCKRHTFVGATTPAADSRANGPRNHVSRHSFGTPSTPLSLTTHQIDPVSFGKNVSIFGTNVAKATLNRRGSFLSSDGDAECSQSPSRSVLRHQPSLDFDLPPTPTKQALVLESGTEVPFRVDGTRRVNSGHTRTISSNGKSEPTCKLSSPLATRGTVKGPGSSTVDRSTPVVSQFRSPFSVPLSFTRSRSARSFKPPAPLTRTSNTLPLFRSDAKSGHLSPASPIQDLFERLSPPKVSPQTPQDAHTPPDPSRLSISAVANAEPFPIFGSVARRLSMAPPATPTAAKDFAPHSSLFSASVTPTAASRIAEIDPVLTARFDKVEPLGVGEFSRVYKVIRYRDLGNPTNRFAPPVHQNSAQTPLREEKWAVKKSRKAYMGVKDREKRLQEVNALKLLGHSDHTIHFFDSWEENNHLYIQTEYCEDGNLSNFLSHAGQHERLDEFRIWKILLEVALVSRCACQMVTP